MVSAHHYMRFVAGCLINPFGTSDDEQEDTNTSDFCREACPPQLSLTLKLDCRFWASKKIIIKSGLLILPEGKPLANSFTSVFYEIVPKGGCIVKIKLRIIRPLLALLMIVLTLGVPLVAIAQYQSEVTLAMAAAERDAQADVNKPIWFCVGCFGLIGLVASYVYTPSPPTSRFIGKSSEYVQTYTTAYSTKAKSIQTRQAITGCVAGCLVGVALNLLFFSASIVGL